MIDLLKQQATDDKEPPNQPDVGLLIDCMTLINKTLAAIPDQDTFFDFVDPLEEAGMESIIQKYTDLDAQLREQFKIYEQSIEAEDEEANDSHHPKVASKATEPEIEANQITTETTKASDMMADRKVVANGNNGLTSSKSASVDPNDDDDEDEVEQNTARRGFNRASMGHSEVVSGVSQRVITNGRDLDESGETTNDDDDYESATDKSPKAATLSKTVVQTLNTEQQHNTIRRQHQLQLRQQQPSLHQRINNNGGGGGGSSSSNNNTNNNLLKQDNLARGKQQRASISSCSSSDSYASYGSGYASGSGNSTDHEHKHHRNKQEIPVAKNSSNHVDASNNLTLVDTNGGLCSQASTRGTSSEKNNHASREHNDYEIVNKVKADRHNEDDSELKQHLNELEQLTDELSKRDIFSDLAKSSQSTTSTQHFSSTIKSSSSNSSSILSTGSNLSSLISNNEDDQSGSLLRNRRQLKQTKSPTSPVPTGGVGHDDIDSNESRSASATPTSCFQPGAVNISKSTNKSAYNQAYLSPRQPQQQVPNNGPMAAHTTSSAKPSSANQYTAPTNTNNQPVSQSPNQKARPTNPSTPAKQQEPYYHNLFQWEQLVSKGVTRPLLINDLDFTDLRDEDDCDLLNSSSSSSSSTNNGVNSMRLNGRNQDGPGAPLTIKIPSGGSLEAQDSTDSGASTSSPSSANAPGTTPASAPPPLPPPPISPWFNTISGSRPQSQFMSSPSPTPYSDYSGAVNSTQQQQQQQQPPNPGEFNRDSSPANSTYSNYSRNSVCVAQNMNSPLNSHYNTLQPVGNLRSASSMSSLLFGNNGRYGNKRKKTMKLFWKEVREDRSLLSKLTKKKTIWDEIKPIQVDTQKLEYLFESKAKDLLLSKSRNGLDGGAQRKVKITVLDAKRSNAINIGMTKLPPMRTIKSAILKMDSSIMNREGIEKILTTMMPSEEEKSRIIEAQLANPDTPLGTAEQFLLNLASISALEARLKLWAFQLDYSQIEKEVAEPLMDLKQAIEEIEKSETFRIVLGTLLAIGNFLNSTNAKGFQIDYLEKVPEVKDTVHKHSLLHHLCLFIQEKYDPELTSDLYSEFSAVNRASKVDYTEVAKNLKKMQQDCKASWDYLKIVAKHDGLANLMNACGGVSSPSSTASCNSSSSSSSSPSSSSNENSPREPKSSGKLNNLSKLSMITTVIGSESSPADQQAGPTTKQLKSKVSDFLTDCAERIMVLMVIHRRVMNRFQKLLVYLGCPSHQIKQTQPQQVLKVINEFALEYRTKRERVREMIMKSQQCHYHNHLHHHGQTKRWQMNRLRWAGSQQCIDSLGYNNRPCSTTSSITSSTYANGMNCSDCALEGRNRSMDNNHYANQQHQGNGCSHRAGSPSDLSSQLGSNCGDYFYDQSCCNSRQVSATPVPSSEKGTIGAQRARPHSMSMSMFDLQNQHSNNSPNRSLQENSTNSSASRENDLARQKDEQMRRLLGAGKSVDGACSDLYQMSHWSTTMARVSRHPATPPSQLAKQRAASIDCSGAEAQKTCGGGGGEDSFDSTGSGSSRRQSSYYRHLNNNRNHCQMDEEPNSDEEILQSLVRAATAKSNHHKGDASLGSRPNNGNQDSSLSGVSNRGAKNKILSRFSCDRKSCK